jgi:16S rRNA (uracil1498-N3)-methyltransferase
MRLHRFYINKKITEKTFDIVDSTLVHQWKKVFRYNVGGQVILFDGFGYDFTCIITSLKNLGATVSVLDKKEVLKQNRKIWLCVSLLKKDNFELVVQKATELGVSNIVPVLFDRSEKKKINEKRLEKIIKEASEQSGRGELMILHPVQTLENLLSSGILPQEKIFLNMDRPPIKNYLNSQKDQYSFSIFVGPEGGFSQKDLDIFKKYNILGFELGKTTLRAETASIVAPSLFLID